MSEIKLDEKRFNEVAADVAADIVLKIDAPEKSLAILAVLAMYSAKISMVLFKDDEKLEIEEDNNNG